MSTVIPSNERKSYLFVVGVLLGLSLVAAIVLFYFLDSFAQIQNKGISIGGAAAGFVIIFLLLRDTYFKVPTSESTIENLSADEKIKKYETMIDQLVTSKFDNWVVPYGYNKEISREFQFGFCYPKEWKFSKFPQLTLYGAAIDFNSVERLGVCRNVNLTFQDISGISIEENSNLHEIFNASMNGAIAMLPNSKLIFEDNFLFQGLPAKKYRIDYVANVSETQTLPLTLYQIAVADKERKNVFALSFTTTKEDFETSRSKFDDIAGTFRI
jgi:hypothetical protein